MIPLSLGFQYPEGSLPPSDFRLNFKAPRSRPSFNTPKGHCHHQTRKTYLFADIMKECFNTPKGHCHHQTKLIETASDDGSNTVSIPRRVTATIRHSWKGASPLARVFQYPEGSLPPSDKPLSLYAKIQRKFQYPEGSLPPSDRETDGSICCLAVSIPRRVTATIRLRTYRVVLRDASGFQYPEGSLPPSDSAHWQV